MRRIVILLAIVLVLAIFAGCLFLAFGNFPASSIRIEKVLPDARFQVLTGCAHVPQLQAPQQFLEAIASFVAA